MYCNICIVTFSSILYTKNNIALKDFSIRIFQRYDYLIICINFFYYLLKEEFLVVGFELKLLNNPTPPHDS